MGDEFIQLTGILGNDLHNIQGILHIVMPVAFQVYSLSDHVTTDNQRRFRAAFADKSKLTPTTERINGQTVGRDRP